ncbi:hypothetical protein [Saccharopolyspora sp. NPDC050642]|uniref:hypothetical protein n=1 Tax=Saccharopolyspora sp. NPDC050642 TaxID=3157099 RepID=UPI0033D8D11C
MKERKPSQHADGLTGLKDLALQVRTSLNNLANALDAFKLALIAAIAVFIVDFIGAIAAACTVVGVGAAICVIITIAGIAIGLITAAGTGLNSYHAWARDGFEFANEAQAVDKIAPRLEHELARAERELGELQATLREPGADTDALRKEIDLREQTLDSAREIMSRFVEGHENFPTPKEISALGRPDGLLPGESRNLQWMGKNVLTGRDYRTGEYVRWHGVKYL